MAKKETKQTKEVHDRGYKRLFSNQTIFRQLIETFVDEPWIKELDFSDCERLDKTFIDAAYRRRESDVIYKIRLKNNEVIYVYILVEFQSTVDPFMVVRFLYYIASFYMDYISNRKGLKKLPAIFPILLYNGSDKWTAKEELSEVIEGPNFGDFGVQLKYFKIAENEKAARMLQAIGNIVSTLFLAEQHYSLEQMIDELVKLFDREEDKEAVKLFLNWICQLAKYGRINEEDLDQMVTEYENSEEVKHMLRTVSLEREERLRAEGRVEGLEKGRVEGLEQGRVEGRKEGEESGKKAGLLVAKQETFVQILEFKFGKISDVIPEMIQLVDNLDELNEWIKRALSAETLNDIWVQSTNEDEVNSA